MKIKQFFGFLVCAALIVLPTMGALTLSQHGKPVAEIVLPPASHPALEFAAQEFQHWVEKISGARLPIVSQAGTANSKLILALNPPQFAKELEQLADNDGYGVKSSGNTVTLYASQPKGILNGVFKLLFRNTDIIWARPNLEYGTLFSHNPNLALREVDYIDVPVYKLRGWQMRSGRDIPNEEWQVRNGCNWSAGSIWYKEDRVKYAPVLEYGGGHNLVGRYIPESKYFDTHPDYYPLKNGHRLRPSKTPTGTQLCFTHPELQQVFIEEIDAIVRDNPAYDIYRIMIEDTWNLCECEACLAPIHLPDGSLIDKDDPSFRSTQFFMWLNPIAKHLHDKHGKRVLTFAYFFTEPPPHCHIEPNIQISFCPIGKNSKRTLTHPENAKTLARLNGWLKLTKNITWREYYGLCPPFPRPIDTIALQDWHIINQWGIDQTYSELRPDYPSVARYTKSWHVNALYFWTMVNGAWDPAQDVEELRKTYLTRVFGPAAEDVGEFYRLIEEQWFALPGVSRYADKAFTNWKRYVFDTDILNACQAALDRAQEKVVHPNAAKMLAGIQTVVNDHVQLLEQGNVVAVKTDDKPLFDPKFQSKVWQQAIPNSCFIQNRTEELFKHPTSVRALYDQDNIYFGFECTHSKPDSMPYAEANHGKNVFPQGESFEIFLEGEWKGVRHFTQMVVNPVNNRYRAVRPAKWASEARITDQGWSGMITLSWESLGLNPADVDTLKASFFRQYMVSPRPGAAPPRNVHIPGSRRHSTSTASQLTLKK